MESRKIVVLINGVRGKMGQEIASAALRLNVAVFPFALSSSASCVFSRKLEDQNLDLQLFQYTVETTKEQKEDIEKLFLNKIFEWESKNYRVIAVDFTLPTAVETNYKFYARLKLPFVMGTTGFDHVRMRSDCNREKISAVIAPNMCKQIVAMQSMIQTAALEYPGSFQGYKLEITESHQKTKVDTSGTAKAMLTNFNTLCGGSVELEQLTKIRTEKEQLEFGVPSNFLSGHAYHTYTLTSSGGDVMFQFKHNVNGRRTYAEGVLDAVMFLHKQIESGSEKRVFDMIDVLRGGNMR